MVKASRRIEGRMAIKWRKLNNAVHRDIGYFFFGMTVIYGLSGIALNHLDDWDPSYSINRREILLPKDHLSKGLSKSELVEILKNAGVNQSYKKHYFPESHIMKVFLESGSVVIDMMNGRGVLETVKRRPIFFEFNYLHYNNPKALWTWFSDLYAAALIVMAVTGLFILRGKNSFRKRGIWLVAVGIAIPLVFLILYYAAL
jgi:hypothetical protein